MWRHDCESQVGEGANGISRVEAGDATAQAAGYQTDHRTENDPAPNVSGAEVKKP